MGVNVDYFRDWVKTHGTSTPPPNMWVSKQKKAYETAVGEYNKEREATAKTIAEQKAAEQAAWEKSTAGIEAGIAPEQYKTILQQTAAKTRDIGDTTVPAGAEKTLESLTGGYKGIGEMAVSEYGKQAEAQKESAEKAATALKMQGGATIDYLERLEKIREGVTAGAASARESFAAVTEKADEYVQAARGRVGEVLAKLDDINAEIGKERDFSKAHAMQASVQATLGSMKAEERNILETYGAESKEYQQFQMSKMNALGTVQSNIHANYQQLQEKQAETYLSTVSDAYTKSNMYLGFQEQQHVDMLKYKADAQNAYDMQVSQFEVGIEQMKAAGMENLANWIIETPTFTMDATPLITMLFDLYSTQVTGQQAARIAKAQEGGGIDWGQIAGAGVGSLFGGVGAGIGSAIGGLFD